MDSQNNRIEEKQRVLARLGAHRILLTERMSNAFLKVPREDFVLDNYRDRAYVDTPLPILSGQTISAIHMVMIYISPSCTDPKIGDIVLEIGCEIGLIPIRRIVHKQNFTKLSNCFNVENNKMGVNSQRMVLFTKK